MTGPLRVLEAPPRLPVARAPLLTRGAVVARRALVHASDGGALEGLDGSRLDALEAALGAALDLALSPPPGPGEDPRVRRGARRSARPRAPSSSEHPRPSLEERASFAVLDALRRAAPAFVHALREEELDRLESEIRRAAADALAER